MNEAREVTSVVWCTFCDHTKGSIDENITWLLQKAESAFAFPSLNVNAVLE